MIKGLARFSLAALVVVAFAASAAAQSNYTVTSSGCGTFSLIGGMPGTVQSSVSFSDDGTQLVTLPFTFMLNGDTPVTEIRISSNGQVNLGLPTNPSTQNNCCTADAVVLGGSVTYARIAVAQEDLNPSSRGNVYYRDNGGSFTISYENVCFFGCDGNVNSQVEMWPNGTVEIRHGGTDDASSDPYACGIENDAAGLAEPCIGGLFGSTGLWPSNGPANNGCTLFSTAATEDCANGVDDDGDGLIDCADPDCIGDPACAGGGGDCDLTPVIALLNLVEAKLDRLETAVDALETKSDRIESTVNALDAAFAALAAEIDEIQANQCEMVRLLTTPQGRRVTECGGVTYSWNDNVDSGD